MTRSIAGLAIVSFVLNACGDQSPPDYASLPLCMADSLSASEYVTWIRKADGAVWTIGNEYTLAELKLFEAMARNQALNPRQIITLPNLPPNYVPRRQEWFPADAVAWETRGWTLCEISPSQQLTCGAYGDTVASLDSVTLVAEAAYTDPFTGTDNYTPIYALKSDGSVWDVINSTPDVQAPSAGTTGIIALSVTESPATRCGVDADGAVWCWGSGFLGDGQASHATEQAPFPVPLSAKATIIAAGYHMTCAVLVDGGVWCWGRQYNAEDWTLPTRVNVDDVATLAMTSSGGACALKKDGTVWCWGESEWSHGHEPEPVVAIGNDAVEVVASITHACARKSDRTIWCWGSSARGSAGPDAYGSVPNAIRGCQ
jgi:hypothetical protein